jgi:hypothetical protein
MDAVPTNVGPCSAWAVSVGFSSVVHPRQLHQRRRGRGRLADNGAAETPPRTEDRAVNDDEAGLLMTSERAAVKKSFHSPVLVCSRPTGIIFPSSP